LAKKIAVALGFDWRLFFGEDCVDTTQKRGERNDQHQAS
jgi:hypothetical protein